MRLALLTLIVALVGCSKDPPASSRPSAPSPGTPALASGAKKIPAKTERPATRPTSRPARATVDLVTLRELYVAGKYRQVVQQGSALLEQQPDNRHALQVVGASHCYLKDGDSARKIFDKLRPAARQLMETICRRNRVELRD